MTRIFSALAIPATSTLRSSDTCGPSPCGRLSRPRTTTTTPSPWASRPVGDPVFGRTNVRARRRSLVRPLERPRWPSPAGRRVRTAKPLPSYPAGTAHTCRGDGCDVPSLESDRRRQFEQRRHEPAVTLIQLVRLAHEQARRLARGRRLGLWVSRGRQDPPADL